MELSTGEAGMLFFVNDMDMVAESEEELQSNTAQLQKKSLYIFLRPASQRHSTRTKQQMLCQKTVWSVVHSKEQQQNL